MEESATNVYVLISHVAGIMAHSFFRIPVPNDYQSINEDNNLLGWKKVLEKMDPILVFPAAIYPRYSMACALLGSTFYFLGGELDFDSHSLFSDVYTFDASSSSSSRLQKLECGMASGKPCPTVFVADGKLFVFGTCISVSNARMNDPEYTRMFESVKFFEVYDPSTDKWQVLEDPPVENPISWVPKCLVLDHLRKVYIHLVQCWHMSSCSFDVVKFIFDLDTYSWTPLSEVCFWQGHPGLVIGGDSFYRLGPKGVMVQKFEPEVKDERQLFMEPVEVGGDSSRGFCFFGKTDTERHFCCIWSDNLPDLQTRYDQFPDRTRRSLHLTVQREMIVGDHEQEEEQASSKVYAASFLVETTYCNLGEIAACYTIRSEEVAVNQRSETKKLTVLEKEENSNSGDDHVEVEGWKETSLQQEESKAPREGKASLTTGANGKNTSKGKKAKAGILALKEHELQSSSPSGRVTSSRNECSSIEVCLKLLNAIPEVKIGSELYMLATRLFIKPQYREMFAALPKDVRLSWLEQYLQREF